MWEPAHLWLLHGEIATALRPRAATRCEVHRPLALVLFISVISFLIDHVDLVVVALALLNFIVIVVVCLHVCVRVCTRAMACR